MKKITQNIATLMVLTVAGTTLATAQVVEQKVGDNNMIMNQNAVLEIESTNRGLLLPRLELTATDSFAPLTAHVEGMTVYNTATAGTGATAVTPGYYYNDGTKWVRIATGADAKTEPWFDQATNTEATSNTQNIYQMGSIAIGKEEALKGTALDVEGAIRGGAENIGDVGVNSVAFGQQNEASGYASTVFGWNNTASSPFEMVLGRFNAITNSSIPSNDTGGSGEVALAGPTDPVLQIGNGNGDANRQNSITVLSNGNTGIGIAGVEDAAKPTERLDIGSGNVRVRDINDNAGTETDKIVVADADGILKTLKAAMPKFFYMPSIIVATSEEQMTAPNSGAVAGDVFNNTTREGTIDLYARYSAQFGTPLVTNPEVSTTLPVLPANKLDYNITWYDNTVFTSVSVSDTGVMSYTVAADADITIGSFMNIVFAVKEE